MDIKAFKLLLWAVIVDSAVFANRRALIIIDVQICFTSGGTLEVADGDQVIPVINDIRDKYDQSFDLVAFSQDWHCPDHVSFYTQHSGHSAYDVIPLYYDNEGNLCKTDNITSSYAINCNGVTQRLDQSLWPEHCVINTTDADLHPRIKQEADDIVVQKGYHCQLDSYSVFFDNGKFGETEMHAKLQQHHIDTVFVTGLARDFCVYWTSLDALALGYKTYMIEDATRPVALNSGITAVNDMKSKGVHVVNSSDLVHILGPDSNHGVFTHTRDLTTHVIHTVIVLLLYAFM